MYYFNVDPKDRVPDIFISYPRVWERVKPKVMGYHLPPIPLEMRTTKKQMMAGQSMEIVGWFEEPTTVDPFSMIWQGPNGRRIEVRANLRQLDVYDAMNDPDLPEFLRDHPNPKIIRKISGRLSMPPWAEPGVHDPVFDRRPERARPLEVLQAGFPSRSARIALLRNPSEPEV